MKRKQNDGHRKTGIKASCRQAQQKQGREEERPAFGNEDWF